MRKNTTHAPQAEKAAAGAASSPPADASDPPEDLDDAALESLITEAVALESLITQVRAAHQTLGMILSLLEGLRHGR